MMSDLIAAPAVIPSLRLTSTDGPGGRHLISAKALEALVDRLEAEQNDAGLLVKFYGIEAAKAKGA